MELALTEFIPTLLSSAAADATAAAATEAATEAALSEAATAAAADAAGTMATTAGITGLDTAVVPSILTGGQGVASIAPGFAGITDAAGITSGGILGASPEAAGLVDAADVAATEAATQSVPELANAATTDFMGQGANAVNTGIPGTNEITGQAYDITKGASSGPGIDLSSMANPPGQGIPTSALEKGVVDPFAQGASSASDLFSKVTDKLGGWADKGMAWAEKNPLQAGMLGIGAMNMLKTAPKPYTPEKYKGPLSKYHLASNYQPAVATPTYYTPQYASYARGGITSLAMGGPATTPQPGQMYPQSQQIHTQFATPTQMPTSAEVINAGYEPATNPYTGDQPLRMAAGGKSESTSNPLIDFYKEHINPKFKEAPEQGEAYLDRLGGVYTDTDPDTIHQDALNAALTRNKKLAALTKPTNFAPQQINPQLAQAQQQAIQAASGGIVGYAAGGSSDVTFQNKIAARGNPNAGLTDPWGFMSSKQMQQMVDPNNVGDAISKAGQLSSNYQAAAPTAMPIYQSSYDGGPNAGDPNYDINVDEYGYPVYASGGIMGYNLGGYARGGNPRLLKGPGDGMSDNIPATIADRQPARLADGEFVVPADVVSHLGNGSTDAGAKKLHTMMDSVRVARTGKKAQGTQINPNKYLPK